MRKILVLLAIIGFAAAAHAQLYKWVDKDGKTRYGDTPPAGVKATALGAPASGSGPAAAVPAAAVAGAAPKDAKKGPLTPAEQAQEYRKRQDEEKKASAKADSERQAQAAKAEDCARAREYLRTLESGQRIARTNAAGERYFMDETQTAQELAKSQQSIQQTCTN